MATVHRSYRLEAETAERVDRYAAAEGIKGSEAVGRLLIAGLDVLETPQEGRERPSEDVSDVDGEKVPTGDNDTVSTLISSLQKQLEAKDEQIATLMRLNDQSQQLQAAQAQQIKALLPGEAEGGEIVTTRRTWRQRLGAWIAGEGR